MEIEVGKTNETNRNKLVLTRGTIQIEKSAKDEFLGFESTKGMILQRNVEILQWQRKPIIDTLGE